MSNSGTHNDAGESVHWGTPPRIVDPVRLFYGGVIDLDPCSNTGSIVKAQTEYMLPHTDGLKARWDVKGPRTKAYVNPPFGRFWIRDDLQVIYSAKEWTRGRKLFQTVTMPGFDGPYPDGVISDVDAARFTGYSIKDWVARCVEADANKEAEIIALFPGATDTAHYQKMIFPTAAAICFIQGRLKFLGGVDGPAPMATNLVYWGDRPEEFKTRFDSVGFVVILR